MEWYNDLSALGKSIAAKGISAGEACDEMKRDNFQLTKGKKGKKKKRKTAKLDN